MSFFLLYLFIKHVIAKIEKKPIYYFCFWEILYDDTLCYKEFMLFFLVCYNMFSMETIEFTHRQVCMYTNSLFYGISKIKARKHKWVTLLSLIKCAETKAMACTYDKQIFCSYLKLWVQILSTLKEERCSCTHCTSLISNRALSNPIITNESWL